MRMFGPLLLIAALASPASATRFTGVNLAGGEFGGPAGEYGKKYIYPDARQMRAFRDMGMNAFRLPVRWERMQPVPGGPLDQTEMGRIDAVIEAAANMGASVILDVHNYARYRRQPIGSPGVSARDFAALWSALAAHYKGNDAVIFGLMNEPVEIAPNDWAGIAQAAIRAIRTSGARNLVLVPGTRWSGAHSWLTRVDGQSNGDALAGFTDPARNMAFDFHQYFDPNSSGTTDACVAPAEAERRLAVATGWLKQVGARGFLSEFGLGRSPECLSLLSSILGTLQREPLWIGWTIWASSAWFGGYHFNLYPFADPRPPQLDIMRPFLAGRSVRELSPNAPRGSVGH